MPDREYHVWKHKSTKERKWRSFYQMAIGYKNVFLQMLYCQESGQGPYDDEEIFPILFIFSQYLELSFKALLLKKKINFKKIHKLAELLGEVEKNYSDFKIDKIRKKIISDTSIINRERMNLDYEGFRYPLKRDGDRIWIKRNKNESFISLSRLSCATKEIIQYIDDYFKKII